MSTFFADAATALTALLEIFDFESWSTIIE
jgi:hypothetical protein